MADPSTVRVAIRVLPIRGSLSTTVSERDALISLSADRSFYFDNVFNVNATQLDVYKACVSDLVDGIFKGYNATVLAYGQTGSGKTHTMGTAFDAELISEDAGVIPRAAKQIFDGVVDQMKKAKVAGVPEPTFYVELYNEEVIDLLAPGRYNTYKIHEDLQTGQIVVENASYKSVCSPHELLAVLRHGASNRKTGSTKMNTVSSRSHAIFSVHVRQECLEAVNTENGVEYMPSALSAKLHFVDLAGSERLHKTGATGERAKEGININKGLLSLGNVINALTDPKKGHVPYRDSKLTRLLQDSLGGNSRTLMIACVSPRSSDTSETFSTLNYAARTKAIQNKVVANKDHSTAVLGQLRAKLTALENGSEENERKISELLIVFMQIIDELTSENKRLNDLLGLATEKLQEHDKQTTELLEQLQNVREALNMEKLKFSTLEDELREKKKDFSESSGSQDEVAELRRTLKIKREAYNKTVQEIVESSVHVDKYNMLKSKLIKMQARANKVDGENIDLKVKLKDLEERLKETEDTNVDLKEEINELRKNSLNSEKCPPENFQTPLLRKRRRTTVFDLQGHQRNFEKRLGNLNKTLFLGADVELESETENESENSVEKEEMKTQTEFEQSKPLKSTENVTKEVRMMDEESFKELQELREERDRVDVIVEQLRKKIAEFEVGQERWTGVITALNTKLTLVTAQRDQYVDEASEEVGHKNQKQKIKYLDKLRQEIKELKNENASLKSHSRKK